MDDLLCIVMEYCGGGDLLQRIQQQKSAQFSTDHVGINHLQLVSLQGVVNLGVWTYEKPEISGLKYLQQSPTSPVTNSNSLDYDDLDTYATVLTDLTYCFLFASLV